MKFWPRKQPHVQVRTHDGELRLFHTVTEAFEDAERDPEVWKISWTEGRYRDRVRLVRYDIEGQALWLYDPMKRYIERAIIREAMGTDPTTEIERGRWK